MPWGGARGLGPLVLGRARGLRMATSTAGPPNTDWRKGAVRDGSGRFTMPWTSIQLPPPLSRALEWSYARGGRAGDAWL